MELTFRHATFAKQRAEYLGEIVDVNRTAIRRREDKVELVVPQLAGL
jgi:hypothetical protein